MAKSRDPGGFVRIWDGKSAGRCTRRNQEGSAGVGPGELSLALLLAAAVGGSRSAQTAGPGCRHLWHSVQTSKAPNEVRPQESPNGPKTGPQGSQEELKRAKQSNPNHKTKNILNQKTTPKPSWTFKEPSRTFWCHHVAPIWAPKTVPKRNRTQ